MAPRTRDTAVEDGITVTQSTKCDAPHFNKKNNNINKRYAAYFASTTSLSKLWSAADTEKRWDLVSSTVTSARNSGSDGNNAAKDTDSRFRASQTVVGAVHNTSTPSRKFSQMSTDNTSLDGQSVLETASIAPVKKELKPRFSRSRRDGLNEARKEAFAIMKQLGLGEKDNIPCDREGCHDLLRDVRALTYHLHIHNVHDRSFPCPACGGLYECKRELSMHMCRARVMSPPTSPIRRAFRCVFTKIACARDDNVEGV